MKQMMLGVFMLIGVYQVDAQACCTSQQETKQCVTNPKCCEEFPECCASLSAMLSSDKSGATTVTHQSFFGKIGSALGIATKSACCFPACCENSEGMASVRAPRVVKFSKFSN